MTKTSQVLKSIAVGICVMGKCVLVAAEEDRQVDDNPQSIEQQKPQQEHPQQIENTHGWRHIVNHIYTRKKHNPLSGMFSLKSPKQTPPRRKHQLVGEALNLHLSEGQSLVRSPDKKRYATRKELSQGRLARSCYHPDECHEIFRFHDIESKVTSGIAGTDDNFLAHDFLSQQKVYDAPFAGMILQVFLTNENIEVEEMPGNLPACSVDHSRQHLPLDSFVYDHAYELLEPLHLELGHIPRHALDYAYTPVVIHNEKDRETEQNKPHGHSQQQQEHHERFANDFEEPCKAVAWGDDEATSSSWWQWWFPFTTSTWWKNHGSTKADFDMGKTAFAGGSHGEVWRGHQICKKPKRKNWKMDNGDSNKSEACDEQQSLIFKRLKVEHGYRLLEAGLREVYFGTVMRAESESLSTVYVDHFFREVDKNLELWIVFQDAGPSLRSYIYTPVSTPGGFIMFQQSPLWTQLRMSSFNSTKARDGANSEVTTEHIEMYNKSSTSSDNENRRARTAGRALLQDVLHQILTSAAQLHSKGIVHRDIKPSNVMCKSDADIANAITNNPPELKCLLGDFSSAWNNFTAEHLYTGGPSPGEQTDEYAPPESYLGQNSWVPFYEGKPQSYDSWSIGVLALELLLGTPNVFSVDQRTTVLLSSKMKKEGASEEEIHQALYLAALSQFCLYNTPTSSETKQDRWPLRDGDPLHNTSMVRESCTLQDFHRALRARDPLGIGFDSSADLLLHLIWQLLAWDPEDRITATDALDHPYFSTPDGGKQPLVDLIPGWHNALECQMLDPRLDFNASDTVHEFTCPKCGRVFSDWQSCLRHARSRRHAKFCMYDKTALPSCINAHSMLPAHPSSGYCDLQGRRKVIEDFHSIHLHHHNQFYGVFDGHTGNLASKYVASTMYETLSMQLAELNQVAASGQANWKDIITRNVSAAFVDIHERFLEAVSLTPNVAMDQSGTTATGLFVSKEAVVIASLGDSRAVLSSSSNDGKNLAAVQLTKDHVASDPDEKKMVESRGGFISSNGGIDRVNGTLAITRSIGDAGLATYLSRDPYVVALTRSEMKETCGVSPCFVIVASDGLWDVMSNEEAVEMVAFVLGSYIETDHVSRDDGGAFQEAAHSLAIEAYVRGSTDNIGVCVIAID